MLSINTNLNAQNSANQIGNAQNMVNKSSERLTTGLRINSAADDVSGLGLSTRLEKTSNQTAQYIENAMNGVSMIQTADAALEQQASLTARMQELAYKAENGSNSTADVALIQKEFDELAKEILRNEKSATFNGTQLLGKLDGTAGGGVNATIAIGEGTANQVAVTVADSKATREAIITDDGAGKIDIVMSLTQASADDFKKEVHEKLQGYSDYVNEQRASLGAAQNRLEFTTENLQSYKQNIDATLSQTRDTDYAEETTKLAKANVLKNASQSMLSQANKSMEDVVNKLLQ